MQRLRHTLAGLVIALTLPVTQAMAQDNPMMAGQAFERLPYSRAVVGFGEGDTVLVTDNPRYVMKGVLWDMWSKAPVANPAALKAAEQRMPLASLNLDLSKGVSRQQGEGGLTVFLDPASPTFLADLDRLGSYRHWQLVLIPLQRDSLNAVQRAACALSNKGSFSSLRSALQSALQQTTEVPDCQSEQVMGSAALASFLHINKSPTIVDAEGRRRTRW